MLRAGNYASAKAHLDRAIALRPEQGEYYYNRANVLKEQKEFKAAIDDCHILSNATRVGMEPNTEQSLITDLDWLRSDLVVTDVVYAPPHTKLLRDAQSAGCKTCDGLGMLLCQGAEAFRLYSGLEMPVEEIRALLYA